jgi:hypothetical protein
MVSSASFGWKSCNTLTWCLHIFPCYAHGQSQETHSDSGLWTNYFLWVCFLDVIRANHKVQLIMRHMNQKTLLPWRQHSQQIVPISCLSQTHDFFVVHCINTIVIDNQLVHVSPNPHVYREIYHWMNRGLLLDWHGSSQWLHFYLTLHEASCNNLQPTFQSWATTQISHTTKMPL